MGAKNKSDMLTGFENQNDNIAAQFTDSSSHHSVKSKEQLQTFNPENSVRETPNSPIKNHGKKMAPQDDITSPWKIGVIDGSDECDLGSTTATILSSDSIDNKQKHIINPRKHRTLRNHKSESYIHSSTSLSPIPSLSQPHPTNPPLPCTAPHLPSIPSSSPHHPYFHRLLDHSTPSMESILRTTCAVTTFSIAEVWLRTGPKTHRLIASYLRPSALDESEKTRLVEIYYGDTPASVTHRLSPVLCKRVKDNHQTEWLVSTTEEGADVLRSAISDVNTAVAVPVCHEESGVNLTFIYFCMKRAIKCFSSVAFFESMSISAAIAGVNPLQSEMFDRAEHLNDAQRTMSRSSVTDLSRRSGASPKAPSLTVDQLGLKWSNLRNVEYLTDGGSSWIHTAVLNDQAVVVKTLKPECQDLVAAIDEIEGEYQIHSQLNHPNIVSLHGAGQTSKGILFVVMERLDGGTLSQVLGYETRVRDRRRRFWNRKHFTYIDVLRHARALADALDYCHRGAIPGCTVLHRDLKPDNIGFTLDGTIKIIDFGLARILENSSPMSDEVYQMSGETGSLRYMAPEVAESRPYNHKADVYSFGIIFWELLASKKPYHGMNRRVFFDKVVRGGERPSISKKWTKDVVSIITECWSPDIGTRPSFEQIVKRLDSILEGMAITEKKKPRVLKLIDRHSTWF